jgi:hypothetical protein
VSTTRNDSGAAGRESSQPDPHVLYLRSFDDCKNVPIIHAHLHNLRRAFEAEPEGLGVSAVLCTGERPAVYFKRADAFDAKQERDWHRQVWNQGAATMLVVEDRHLVRVYSAMVQPKDDAIVPDGDSRLVEQLERAAFVQEQVQFFRSIATGQYYQIQANQLKFLSGRPVDEYLLDNLSAARDKLCDKTQDGHLAPETAHAFLGRTLFTCYLLEREIIGSHHLKAAGAPVAKTLHRVLEKAATNSAGITILYRLFRQLQEDFNGSLFGNELPGEEAKIRAWHIEVLKDFLCGSDVKAGQAILPQLDFYDFRFIPIELISGIYEHFLAGDNVDEEVEEKESENTIKSKRREAGAYYTPPRLAELVVDVAIGEWPTLLGKRFLDPACGSGIFLVILFHRMAEEWRRLNPKANNIERALKLRDFLMTNFCGLDLDETACMVACFSLYLAFMDQLEPRDIEGLKQALARRNAGKVLPPLMLDDQHNSCSAIPVIRRIDFFTDNSAPLGEFHLVIGNPPWKGRNQSQKKKLEEWLVSDKTPVKNSFLKEWLDTSEKLPTKDERKARFFPQDQSAIGFMWKAPLHACVDGQVCLLLPSRVTMSNDTDAFQAAWFARFNVLSVWQLADYRRILFNGAICPAVIVHHDVHAPTNVKPTIRYLTPKVDRLDPRIGTLPVLPEDEKKISVVELIRDAGRGRAFTTWKKHFWGTARDRRVIDRLLAMSPLSNIAGEVREKKRWNKGQGFQPRNKNTIKPDPVFWKTTDWFLDATNDRPDLVLLTDDCVRIRDRFKTGLHRAREPEIYQPPMVLVNQGCTRFVYSDFPVLFEHSLQSISASTSVAKSNTDEELLLFLCAVFNSPLANYFYFHTSANLGIERDKVHLNELLLLPFPLPDDTDDPKESWTLVRKAADTLRTLRQELNKFAWDQERENLCSDAKLALTKLVYRYYDVATWEQDLMQETVDVFKRSIIPSSLRVLTLPTLKESSENQRRDYADYLQRTLNAWAHLHSWKLSVRGQLDRRGGLCLLTLTRDGLEAAYKESEADVRFEKLLERLAKAAEKQHNTISFLRGFYLIDINGGAIHILKPLAYRHWTKTAALNDADEFWGALLQAGDRRK